MVIIYGYPEANVPIMATLVRGTTRAGYSYQRSNRGPINAPIDAASNMQSEYQVSTKIAETSGQWRQ